MEKHKVLGNIKELSNKINFMEKVSIQMKTKISFQVNLKMISQLEYFNADIKMEMYIKVYSKITNHMEWV